MLALRRVNALMLAYVGAALLVLLMLAVPLRTALAAVLARGLPARRCPRTSTTDHH